MTPEIARFVDKLPDAVKLTAQALDAIDQQLGRAKMLAYARASHDFDVKWLACVLHNTEVAVTLITVGSELDEKIALAKRPEELNRLEKEKERLGRRLHKALTEDWPT